MTRSRAGSKPWASRSPCSRPPTGSDVKGDTRVTVSAPGLQEPDRQVLEAGTRPLALIPRWPTCFWMRTGNGSFVFPADSYPHGPITVRIHGESGLREGQLLSSTVQQGRRFLERGVAPDGSAPAARGMKLDLRRRLQRAPVDLQHEPQSHLLRPQAPRRISGLQRPHVLRPRIRQRTRLPGSIPTSASGPAMHFIARGSSPRSRTTARASRRRSRATSSAASSAPTPSAPGRPSG